MIATILLVFAFVLACCAAWLHDLIKEAQTLQLQYNARHAALLQELAPLQAQIDELQEKINKLNHQLHGGISA